MEPKMALDRELAMVQEASRRQTVGEEIAAVAAAMVPETASATVQEAVADRPTLFYKLSDRSRNGDPFRPSGASVVEQMGTLSGPLA